MDFHPLKRLVMALAISAAGANLAQAAVPTTAAYGALANFDVYNFSTDDYVGFEIEMQGLHKSAIPTYGIDNTPAVFVVPGRLQPTLTEIGDATNFATILRYSGFDANGNVAYAVKPFDFANQPLATDGHACVFGQGCEHFGMGYYGNPTSVRYQWLKAAPTTPGTFINGPLVQLGTATWNVVPAAPNAQPVDVNVERPEQENPNDAAPPQWVKVFVDKAHKDQDVVHDAFHPEDAGLEMQARLNALRSGRDDVVPQGHLDANGDPVPEDNYEWELLTEGGQPKSRHNDLALDDVQLARRFEFYEFAGTPAQLLACSALHGAKPDACNPDKTGGLVGNLIGAQMAAVNFDLIQPPAPVPVPASLPLLLSALVGVVTLAGRTGRRR